MNNNAYAQSSSVRCASLEFDLELGLVINALGETQRLSPINLKLLAYLLKHQGQVVGRTELFDAIWPNQLVSDDVLTRVVSDVRTQLTKLDADTKFIETLPKRGYRWAVDVLPAGELEEKKSEDEQSQLRLIDSSPSLATLTNKLKFALFYLSLAVGLAILFMWGVNQSFNARTTSIAVLPAVVGRPSSEPLAQIVDDALLSVLRKNAKVQLLSASAIKSRPQNPFPYFANEFGAALVIESRITDLDGINNIELSLVDARTGIELRNVKFDIADRADIYHKVAQKIEFDLLTEYLSY